MLRLGCGFNLLEMQSGEPHEIKACALQDAVGRVEACPGMLCPFWDARGIGCVIAPVEIELPQQPALAQHLLALRMQLDSARRHREAATQRPLFHRLLNEEQAAEA
jgi:hypothetical protein